MKVNIYEYVTPIKSGAKDRIEYQVIKGKTYYSDRYNKEVSITTNDSPYDGATGAKDINSFGWLFHDVLKRDKKWADGSKCSNWKASKVLYDILKEEGRWFRARSWFISTLIWGTFVK